MWFKGGRSPMERFVDATQRVPVEQVAHLLAEFGMV